MPESCDKFQQIFPLPLPVRFDLPIGHSGMVSAIAILEKYYFKAETINSEFKTYLNILVKETLAF